MKRKVYYVLDSKLLQASKNITNIRSRAFVVESLIASYNLLSKCEIINGEIATDDDLLSFHCREYLSYLKKAQDSPSLDILTDAPDTDDFNLGYDCPLFQNIYSFVQLIAGSSLSAARRLVSNVKKEEDISNKLVGDYGNIQPKSYLKYKYKDSIKSKNDDVFEVPLDLSMDENLGFNLREEKEVSLNRMKKNDAMKSVANVTDKDEVYQVYHNVAINWFGGWHHAQRDSAEGFCYVNDIVIAIQFLLKTFKRVLYIDLDVHHGNGVENAFLFSPRVFVLSMHKYESGFYPASGSLDDIGEGNGKFYTANVPFKDGITDKVYEQVFFMVVGKILKKFKPECIVMQCGADSISGDPLGGFNLTPVALGNCLRFVLKEKIPTLVLGGGGYNIANTARCWAYLTSVVIDCQLSDDIPDNSYFQLFGPGFELAVTPTLRRNENTEEYIKMILEKVLDNLDFLPDVDQKAL